MTLINIKYLINFSFFLHLFDSEDPSKITPRFSLAAGELPSHNFLGIESSKQLSPNGCREEDQEGKRRCNQWYS
jgi:hypothetical protein